MIIGHKEIIEQLKNLADNKFLAHSYLFWGEEYLGKKTVAKALANYLENKIFDVPQKILSDFLEINPQKNQNEDETTALEEIRTIRFFLSQKPNNSSYRTVIIDNAQKLNRYAQNALLKISEEPQKDSLIILITRDPDLLLQTLSSRFQKIYFGRVKDEEIKEWLIKNFQINENKANKITEMSFGHPGIAWLILNDLNWKKQIRNAKMFLELKGKERLDFIKELIEDENFNMDSFLEAIMLVLGKINSKNIKLWNRILRLRIDFRFYNLNPKLQLVALTNFLKNDR
jgi:DNA polymerase-3 subunit delta'